MICNKPINMANEFDRIIVNRIGSSPESFMKTEKIIGSIEPNRTYIIHNAYLEKTDNDYIEVNMDIKTPKHTMIDDKWNKDKIHEVNNSNILGGNGELVIDFDLVIPIAKTTSEELNFYGCKLLKIGDSIKFETDQTLPVTTMEIGRNYVIDYLLKPVGGGCYLEYHDTPHFHMPLNEKSDGHLILGKKQNGKIILSAFNIPYGYAIYTPGWVIHADAYLIGKYLVVYTIANEYSTVLLRNGDKLNNVSIK